MNVLECMRINVIPCQLNDNAESVALKMWEHQLKYFPIVDNEQKIIGIITDSDICKYSVMKHKPIWEMNIREIYQHHVVYSCHQDDNSKTALNILIKNHLHWLSVINQQQQFMGVIGLSDIISTIPKKI
ncbi:MAG: CBS domain-containing protein [Colwellia sp.]|nr:CBS domain-containing protein [Colwellia sp.]